MLNHKHNVHKRTNSKILLIILCIFGLLFSWSCSCKNRVSDPNETPINGGNGGDSWKDDSGQIIRTNGGAVSGEYQIVVASAGDTVKTTATVKFLNATGKLTAIADVDATANTGLTLDDFNYSGTTLTFKKDTADTTKYDATTLAKVTWSGVDTKKVKATFTLTPSASNVDLTATTQEVEIEIGKFGAWDMSKDVADTLKNIKASIRTKAGIRFDFSDGVQQGSSIKLHPNDENNDFPNGTEVSKNDFIENLVNILNDNYYNQGRFSSVSKKEGSDSVNTTTFSFSIIINITASPFYEQPSSGVNEYKIEADLKWTQRNEERTGKWIE